MFGKELLAEIARQRADSHQFIRWWRREEDFLDFDLIDRFIANVREDEEIGGFDLLGMEEMWQILRKATDGRVERTESGGGPTIVWRKKSGEQRTCSLTPQSCIEILDAETRGNVID